MKENPDKENTLEQVQLNVTQNVSSCYMLFFMLQSGNNRYIYLI